MIIFKKAQNGNDSDSLENNLKMIKTVNEHLDHLDHLQTGLGTLPPPPSPAKFKGPRRDAVPLELPFGKGGDIWGRVYDLIGDLPPGVQESLIQRFRDRPEVLLNLKRVKEVCYARAEAEKGKWRVCEV